MTIYERIIDYFKYIDMTWPRDFPGLTIEYRQEGYGQFSIYTIVKYDGFCIKQVFNVDNWIDSDTTLEYVKKTMQKMRDEVIRKGEMNRRISYAERETCYAERRNMRAISLIDTWNPYLPLHSMPKPKKIILNDPATIILWSDNTKTIVKKNSKDKKFDPEKGIALCYMKKALGNKGNYNNVFKDWIK